MRNLFSIKRAASIVSLPKKSVKQLLRHKSLITSSSAITRTGLESGFVTELRVTRYEHGVKFDETYLRLTTKGILMLIEEVTHEV